MLRQNGPIIRQAPGGFDLPLQIAAGKPGRRLIQAQPGKGIQKLSLLLRFLEHAHHPSKAYSRFFVPPLDFPFPERQPCALHGRSGHGHGVLPNIDHPPGKGSQDKTVSLTGLIDKLLVRLSHLYPFLRLHGVEALVGNGSARPDGQHPAVAVSLHPLMDSVIQNSGTHRKIPAVLVVSRKHAEHGFYLLPCHIPERPRPGQDIHDLVHPVALKSRHGNQMLGKHVKTSAGRVDLFHISLPGKLSSHPAQHALGRSPGKQIHDAGAPRIVPRPPKPLHGA